MKKRQKFYMFWKRLFDILSSTIAIIVFSPLLLILAILIKCDSKGPVLFKQVRIGKNKKPFRIWKFRSMRINAPQNSPTHMLEHPELYITRIGRFMRKLSLDELPQLFNILGGKMSVIGPRPTLWNQDDLIVEREKFNVYCVRPGLSGLAQINGRDEVGVSKKAHLDGVYIQRLSLWLDIKILFITIFKVFKHSGIVEGKRIEQQPEMSEESAKETIKM